MAVLKAEDVATKIREMHGNLAAVARAFGVTRQSAHEFVERHPTLKAICLECRESMTDNAESALYKAVLAGEAWAVCFYLKCQAKGRGYTERQELDIKGSMILLTEEIVDADPPKDDPPASGAA